jgi:hypothetical protein
LPSDLSRTARDLLRMQAGPHAARVFNALPTSDTTTLEPHLFCGFLLRRLCLPLPLSANHCRCRHSLDPFCDHHATCSRDAVLKARRRPLEVAAARACREARARVTENALLRKTLTLAWQNITKDFWKWWRTLCLCGEARGSQWTRRWSCRFPRKRSTTGRCGIHKMELA